MKKILFSFLIIILFTFVSFVAFFPHNLVQAQSAEYSLYTDALGTNVLNWSWGSAVNLDNTSPVSSGSKSIAFTPSPWGALYLHTDSPISTSLYQNLQFSIYATAPTTKFRVLVYDQNNQLIQNNILLSNFGGDPVKNSWKTYTIPVGTLGTSLIKGIGLQEISGTNQTTLYVDTIRFVGITQPTPTPTNQPTPTPTPQPIATPTPSPTATKTFPIFTDTLTSGFINWSWGANVWFNATTKQEGSSAIGFAPYSNWAGLYLHTDTAVDTTPYTTLQFYAFATAADEKLGIIVYDQNNQPLKSVTSIDAYGGKLSQNTWKQYNIPLSDLNASAKQIKGIVLQDTTGGVEPTLYIDALMLTTASSPSLLPSPPPTPIPVQGYTATDNKIAKNGTPIVLHGISWFGFETGTHAPHGLWVRNWKDLITQIKSLGFTAVRVPFCPATLQGVNPTSIDYGKNPDLQNLSSLQIVDKVMNELNRQQLYILLDHHTPDCNTISDLWYTGSYSETQWIKDLEFVADRYKNLDYFMGIDIKNEPKGSATWGTGTAATDWNKAAEKAGQAVLAKNPNLLIFIQGIQDNPTCSGNLAHWQGGNFEPVTCTPLSAAAIPLQKQVFSPHVYGPDVYNQPYFSDTNFPNNMPAIWDTHFGFLAAKGYTLVPGEWGGKYATAGGNPKDATLQDALVNYFISKRICNSFYWDLNPNSTDTGGILQDDWTTPWPTKMQLIRRYFSSCT